MPITETGPTTLDAVLNKIREMEKFYGFSTATFLSEKSSQIDCDDAHEWHYLLMQKKAFEACGASHRPYGCVKQPKEFTRVDEREAQVNLAA